MKVWIVFELVFDEYFTEQGLGAPVAACLDEEQAADVVLKLNAAWWRAQPAVFAMAHSFELDNYGFEGVETEHPGPVNRDPTTMSDDAIGYYSEMAGTTRHRVEIIELPQALQASAAEKSAALRVVAALLQPFAPDAAAALQEEQK